MEYDMKLYDKFIQFLKKEFPLEHDIEIRFMSSRIDEMTTGARTNNHTLKILVKGRMNRDILRTIAHEWVHEYQRTVLGRKKQKGIGSKNENEANAKAGEVIKKFEDKYPKMVDSLYESVIKRVLKAELLKEDDSDWDWVKNDSPFELGPYLDTLDTCFNSTDCDLNINEKEIILKLDYSDFHDNFLPDINEDDSSFLQTLMTGTIPRDDWYEFDSDEFNYAGYNMSGEQREKLQKLLSVVNKKDFNLEPFLSDDLNSIRRHLKYPKVMDDWNELVDCYLNIIGYTIQRNRWQSLLDYYRELTINNNELPFKLSMGSWDTITMVIPLNNLFVLLSENKISNVEDYLRFTLRRVNNTNWYDYFYEEWDTSGDEGRISDCFDTFLNDFEEFILEETEEKEIFDELYDKVISLGFEPSRSYWGSRDKFIKKNDDGSVWRISDIDYDDKKVKLSKYASNGWSPDSSYWLGFDEISTYVLNYSLDL